MRRLEELAQDRSMMIGGLAVTGDLVDTPSTEAFRAAATIIREAADTLRLTEPPHGNAGTEHGWQDRV